MPGFGGTINIGRYKIPVVALLAGVVGLAVLLVMRAKGRSAQVATAGAAPAASQLSGVYGSGPNATQSDLATLQSQLEGELQLALAGNRPPVVPVVPPAPPPPTVLAPPNPSSGPMNPTPTPISGGGPVGDLASLQIHQGDTPQSLTAYWTGHGFPGFTAGELAASNQGVPFLPGNTWHIFAPGGHL